MSKNVLLAQIKLKQKDMYLEAKIFGFTHPRVIKCSQELDLLLNKYQETEDLLNKYQALKAV